MTDLVRNMFTEREQGGISRLKKIALFIRENIKLLDIGSGRGEFTYLASQITSSEDLFEVLSEKNYAPISKCLTKQKTKLDKDINIFVKDLMFLINN